MSKQDKYYDHVREKFGETSAIRYLLKNEISKLFVEGSAIFSIGNITRPWINRITVYWHHPDVQETVKNIRNIDPDAAISYNYGTEWRNHKPVESPSQDGKQNGTL